MPLIRISHAASYAQPVKDRLMVEVTAAYAAATGCDPAKVWVIVDEVDKSDWATGGTSLAAKAKALAAG
ncbi:tautomerase family protein [Aminobacter aminovorans]|uniref:tautomerase family protein n=1 Tax=Aminobacter TaxID=31988 RepID=UPI00285FE2B4|nr:tautomerase family protein [Aminobacter aminovorans]MDR7225195.1 4-oxalocrotonate tautomerase [Aminobacter aminovorans]